MKTASGFGHPEAAKATGMPSDEKVWELGKRRGRGTH